MTPKKDTRLYQPESVSAPGETLAEVLSEAGMTQDELARRMRRSPQMVNRLLQGKVPLTVETALQLERAVRIPARFWMSREARYQEFRARQEEAVRLRSDLDWMKELPLAAMIRYGWVERLKVPELQLAALLEYFQVASVQAWRDQWEHEAVAWRRSDKAAISFGAVVAWLWQGERQSRELQVAPYEEAAFRKVLKQCRALSQQPVQESLPKLVQAFRDAGVALVVVPELPGAPVSGASRWLHPDQALIQLSLRFKRDDQFWFSLYHEAAHVLLHQKRQTFIDGTASDSESAVEQEANEFAAELLIPSSHYAAFLETRFISAQAVKAFAASIDIAPGIVVGRLQHDGLLRQSHLNGLKRSLRWDHAGQRVEDAS
ncbi:MAG: hypothetical protein GEEBNDBF_02452 [bacterium]|nr:hypothetical protein [bacterium]